MRLFSSDRQQKRSPFSQQTGRQPLFNRRLNIA